MAEYHNQSKLRFWCQMVLPLVYDDSLSYMELLNKVVTYLNNCIQDVGNCETNIESLLEAFVNLQDYVNEIVEDMSPEIEAKIDEMIENGDFAEVMADALNGVLAEEYDPDKSGGYLALDYVLHDGKLYACTGSTSGDWDSTKWRECTVGDELNNLMTRVYGLTAGQVAYNGSATYPDDTVGKELGNLNSAINSLSALRAKAGAKNFIPYPYSDTTKTTNGITFTDNQDGGVGINGTATDWAYFTLSNTDFGNSDIYSTVDNNPVYKAILINGTTNVFIVYYNSSKKTYIAIRPTTEVNNITVYPMMCFKEETDTTKFELYAKTNVQLTEDVDNLNGAINNVQGQITANVQTNTTASKKYNKGEFLVLNGVLYRVTTTIANGGTITPNTNVTAVTTTTAFDSYNEFVVTAKASPTSANVTDITFRNIGALFQLYIAMTTTESLANGGTITVEIPRVANGTFFGAGFVGDQPYQCLLENGGTTTYARVRNLSGSAIASGTNIRYSVFGFGYTTNLV